MCEVLEGLRDRIWGVPMLVLILGCGIYLTIRTGCIQIRWLPRAARALIRLGTSKDDSGERTGFRALCTALSATVGTGNIAGVAGAICLGGPGTVFWMWLFAFFGMAVKFAEATLAVRFRRTDARGCYGGPMYMMEDGLGKRWRILGLLYSFFGVVAALGVGNAIQINTVVVGINSVLESTGIPSGWQGNAIIGLILAIFIGYCMRNGGSRIGRVAEGLVPVACGGYVLLCLVAIFLRPQGVHRALSMILQGAFTPAAVTGGTLGSGFIALRVGASRGLFTNEAGMGTASIAHAGAKVSHPAQQGLMGIMEVFLDTIVICSMTAMVILSSAVEIPYGFDSGLGLTVAAFSSILGAWVRIPIALFLCLFAIATVLGWGLYGTVCSRYLLGEGSIRWFCRMQIITVFCSAMMQTQMVWILSEIVNGLMAFPNLIVLFALSPEVFAQVSGYKKLLRKNGGAS